MLPQKNPQLKLLLTPLSPLSFVIVRLICRQAADIQDVSAVSVLSCTRAPGTIIHVLASFLLLSQMRTSVSTGSLPRQILQDIGRSQ